ncbi:MAG: hypothetical protein ACLGGU_03565, partial [Gammaproteobacteria bacterium]
VTDRLAEIGRNGNHWLEPLEGFINAAHQAQIVASGHDLESLKDFLKRIGSNLRLSGRALRFAYENPWAIVARCRPPAAPRAAQTGETATAPSVARGPRLDPIGENEKWWARKDSNLRPRDSLFPAISSGSGLSHHPRIHRSGCGTLKACD